MKKIKFLVAILLGALSLTACMNEDWQAPDFGDNPPYGNNEIVASLSKKITIADLKNKYANVFSQKSGFQQVTDDLQLHVVVNGNDQGGNIYKQISVQDETGGIIIGINGTDLYAMMPVGQKLVINLKGLYVGTYGSMAQIGSEYNGGLGRMELATWKKSVRLVGDEVAGLDENDQPVTIKMNSVVDIIPFTPASDYNSMIGRIVELNNVTISGEGTQTLAPEDGSVRLTSNCANRNIIGAGTNNIVLRTSTYSDFATRPIPTGKVKVIGVCTYYNGTWQILMRTNSDLVEI
ncbi:MAG: hypothetical protein IKU79_00045 [Bacteroidaceae bacterium]|nr:hypothetical protein [Bacteroidaceae bacterium]